MHKWLLYLVYHGLCLLGLCVYEVEKREPDLSFRNFQWPLSWTELWVVKTQHPKADVSISLMSIRVAFSVCHSWTPETFFPHHGFCRCLLSFFSPQFASAAHKKVREKKGDSPATRSLAASQNDETKTEHGLSSIFSFYTFTAVFILFLSFYLFPTDVYSTS